MGFAENTDFFKSSWQLLAPPPWNLLFWIFFRNKQFMQIAVLYSLFANTVWFVKKEFTVLQEQANNNPSGRIKRNHEVDPHMIFFFLLQASDKQTFTPVIQKNYYKGMRLKYSI